MYIFVLVHDTLNVCIRGDIFDSSFPSSSYFFFEIVISNDTVKRAEEYRDLIHLYMEGTPISRRKTIRILGFHLKYNRKQSVWMDHITKQINDIHHMLGRVTRRGRVHREDEFRKTIEALFYTRVMYHLPYLTLSKTQTNKLEILLRKDTRLALRVPRLTPIHILRLAGLFNSLQDRATIHHHVQQQRLLTSLQERQILVHENP